MRERFQITHLSWLGIAIPHFPGHYGRYVDFFSKVEVVLYAYYVNIPATTFYLVKILNHDPKRHQ